MVEPKGIDAFDNELPYAQRLQWAKEMFRIGANLAQWDWSDITFAIGPVQINWEAGVVSLPHNFDGDNFLRYVEQIHVDAKAKVRDELLKASAMERLRLDESRRSETMQQDALVNEAQSSALDESEAGGGADQEAALRRSHPQLEEYVASDPSGRDAMSVERPLEHRVTFHSDEEAEEQLAWEARLSSPYVQVVPQSDLDDIQAVYYKTNRNFREAAAKKVIDELKAKYGTGHKNRFKHMKMGDMLGLNDPRVKPQGFPILAKGTDQGDKSYGPSVF
jgi:hypothetical protein